jgi:hypothetical protein
MRSRFESLNRPLLAFSVLVPDLRAERGILAQLGAAVVPPGQENTVQNFRGSWHFKLDRAEKHLKEVNDAIALYARTRPYRATRDLEANPDPHVYVVRAELAEQPDYTLATLLGDFFYDLRSPLDHMAVALVPENRRRWASFPICLQDPWELDPQTGQPFVFKERADARRAFKDATRGMSAAAFAAIKSLQPYNDGPNAQENPLAVLDSFAQADKHRELVVVARYLRNPQTSLTMLDDSAQFIQTHIGLATDGAIVASFPFSEPVHDSEVEVHVHGAVEVGVKLAPAIADYPLPGTLDALLDYLRLIVPVLEQHMAKAARI